MSAMNGETRTGITTNPDKSHLSIARSITPRTRSADIEEEGAYKIWAEREVTTAAQREFFAMEWQGFAL